LTGYALKKTGSTKAEKLKPLSHEDFGKLGYQKMISILFCATANCSLLCELSDDNQANHKISFLENPRNYLPSVKPPHTTHAPLADIMANDPTLIKRTKCAQCNSHAKADIVVCFTN